VSIEISYIEEFDLSVGNKELRVEVYDSLNNLISQQSIGGDIDWTQVTGMALTKGDTYTIKWIYINNDSHAGNKQ